MDFTTEPTENTEKRIHRKDAKSAEESLLIDGFHRPGMFDPFGFVFTTSNFSFAAFAPSRESRF
jgi:hypothetical protein